MLEKMKKAEVLADAVGDFAKLQVSAMAELSSEIERLQEHCQALEGMLTGLRANVSREAT